MKLNSLLDKLFFFLIAIVLIAKVMNWFLNFSSEINTMISATMFSLIGIAYVYAGLLWYKKLIQTIFILCGIFLIGMNFLNETTWISIMAIICLLTPMIIGRISSKDKNELAEQ
ncbi:hypothetical protein [Algoriphagus formosus]|uniref:hypothetical protein n=1 Tax=Algoriphagus formosus TaxID=2007308 RepID=UPI003F6F8096